MAAELSPGHLLDDLLQGSDTSGQRDERIGLLEHPLLALVHVARLDDPAAAERMLAIDQKGRDHADRLATAVEHRVGDFSHQPDRSAAIDQADTVVGQDGAESPRGFDEGRVGARSRPAIDADSLNRAHFGRI